MRLFRSQFCVTLTTFCLCVQVPGQNLLHAGELLGHLRCLSHLPTPFPPICILVGCNTFFRCALPLHIVDKVLQPGCSLHAVHVREDGPPSLRRNTLGQSAPFLSDACYQPVIDSQQIEGVSFIRQRGFDNRSLWKVIRADFHH